MEKAFYIQLVSYGPFLKQERINYKEDEKTLSVGKIGAGCGYAIFVSCRTLDTPELLKKIIPILKLTKCPFRIIKNQSLQYRLNDGSFGEDEAGKVVSIFPLTISEAQSLVQLTVEISESYKGQIIQNAHRVGKNVFIQAVSGPSDSLKLSQPDLKGFPFAIPKKFLAKKKKHGLVGNFYLPVALIRSSTKGNIYKAINLKWLSFDWCLVKQGNPGALDDHFDRDMRDRLLWQKEVILQIQSEVYTPQVLDYFERNESSYLVMAYAEGESFGHVVRDALNGQQWKLLNQETQVRLMGFYLKIIKLIESVHRKNFVHRDITDSNFVIMEDESLCIIDFELSYSLKENRPSPPFLLGTYGYAAPEQLQYAIPDIKEDIYSLGALLSFTISGCPPHEFLNTNYSNLKAKLQRLSGSSAISSLILNCLKEKRQERPELGEIKNVVRDYLETIKPKHYEKVPMAV